MAYDSQGRLLSDDGNWYWDGSQWQPVSQPDAQAQSADQHAADLDRDYKGWLGEGSYSEAAVALNGFNLDDIGARLSSLTPEQIAQLHQAAVNDSRLGSQSQVALVTGVDQQSDGVSWWQKNEDTIWDIAVGKGLVVIGERRGNDHR